ncbi:VWA domain-containing protein [Actinoplanes sp. NPDC051861]|uniref:VWA domain-containing protein n=1 Tax=Actinoplanes sp. NPDC051861 TaxID=3155170 RepID=UPI00343B69E8
MIHSKLSKVAAIGLIAASALLGATPARADEVPETETDPPRVELVLDVSGSMRAADIDGATRMDVAKQAFNDVVDALPETTQLGIRVLGATYGGKNKRTGCRDTQQIVPVGPVNRVAAKNAIASLQPTGFTPIGLALRGAATDLGDTGSVRRIVLITDGEDTCTPPDPCEVARELAAQGTSLVVDTLGLTPDEKTRKQLVCISTATGGTYASAKSEEELTDRIKQLVDRAALPPPVTPAVVAGTEDCEGAPLLAAGVYTDRELIGQHRFYRVAVRPDQELRASVSISLDRPLNRDYGVLLKAAAPDGRELVRGVDAGSGRADVLSTGLRWSLPSSDSDSDSGAASNDVCLIVSNSFASATAAGAPGMPVELTVGLVDASDTPDAPGLGRGWLLLLVLAAAGLVAGVLTGWLTRWWVAKWREN